MSTSNTLEVFRESVGKTILGLYTEEREHAGRVVVLVMSDGTGLAFGTGNGSHWTVSKDDVEMRARQRREELQALERDLRDVLKSEAVLAGGAPR